jgi:DnaJ domain
VQDFLAARRWEQAHGPRSERAGATRFGADSDSQQFFEQLLEEELDERERVRAWYQRQHQAGAARTQRAEWPAAAPEADPETASHLANLGLAAVPATRAALKRAYHAAAKSCHPDTGGAGASRARFQAVSEAVQFLEPQVREDE